MTSCNISLSSDRSATIRFNRPFSSSISLGIKPVYSVPQLKYVAWLIPAVRQISSTGVPFSPFRMINALCPSANFDAFMVLRPIPDPGNDPEDANLKRGHVVEADQLERRPRETVLSIISFRCTRSLGGHGNQSREPERVAQVSLGSRVSCTIGIDSTTDAAFPSATTRFATATNPRARETVSNPASTLAPHIIMARMRGTSVG